MNPVAPLIEYVRAAGSRCPSSSAASPQNHVLETA